MEHGAEPGWTHPDGASTMTVSTSPGYARVRLSGEVDLAVAVAFRTQLRDLLVDGHTEVVIDLAEVTFMDSSALGVLVSGQRQARVFRGSLRLADPSQPVRRLLSLTSLDKVFEVSDAAEDA
jgi:anti-sigma B factor antagonist